MRYNPELSCFIRRAMSLIEPGEKMRIKIRSRSGQVFPFREMIMEITNSRVNIDGFLNGWRYTMGHSTLGVSLVRDFDGFYLKLSDKWIDSEDEVKDYW